MPQYVQVKNNQSGMISKMEAKIAEDWIARHDEDPKTKGQYSILAPVKVVVSNPDEKKPCKNC